jgi:quercetin dioxygenase-like cupin family protein
MRKAVLVMLAASAVAAATIATVHFDTASGREHSVRITPLFSTGVTVMGEPITYPTGAPAKLTGMMIAMAPGAETGWHTHSAPLAGIVIEGELTVDYGTRGKRIYRQGEALAEAIAVPHNGKNSGSGLMRRFAVIIGADGLAGTLPARAPAGASP